MSSHSGSYERHKDAFQHLFHSNGADQCRIYWQISYPRPRSVPGYRICLRRGEGNITHKWDIKMQSNTDCLTAATRNRSARISRIAAIPLSPPVRIGIAHAGTLAGHPSQVRPGAGAATNGAVSIDAGGFPMNTSSPSHVCRFSLFNGGGDPRLERT